MITDEHGLLKYVNPAWQSIYGYKANEALGKKPSLLHSGKQGLDFYRDMWKDIRNPEVAQWKGEITNRTKNGELVDAFLTITPFKTPCSNHISGYMGIALNISQQKRLEAKIVRQDKLSSVGLLASGLAHEIGTPLGVIRGRSELLQMKNRDNPELVDALGIVVRQIDRISGLIQSLLRLARPNPPEQAHAMQVKEVLSDVFVLLEKTFKKADISFQNLICENCKVMAERETLQQIFLNLMMNSVHAIEDATETQDRRTGHFLRLNSEVEENGEISLSVEDSGTGISKENMGKLFEPFFTTKDVGRGTGLGLAMVAKLCNEIGAHIDVESHVGIGTKFTVRFLPTPAGIGFGG